MTKYSDIEIQTAKNLLEQGYKWIARNQSGRLYAHAAKPSKVGTYWWSVGNYDRTCDYVPIFQSVRSDDKEPVSLESIVHPHILDEAEREYLSAVIKPFRDKVEYITKKPLVYKEYIYIHIYADNIMLPRFKTGAMYKGMEKNKNYSLEELGL